MYLDNMHYISKIILGEGFSSVEELTEAVIDRQACGNCVDLSPETHNSLYQELN